ncbi:MAG: trigger factor [Lachnospiraceae bacterium]|nr:trigger factor [Lachnospiraceae bacterium]
MNTKIEKTENKNEIKLEFTIDAEKFVDAINKVYEKNSKYFNIPGFRKGKAPMKIVERHYGSEIFYEDAFNELVPEIYDNEIKENDLHAVSKPRIDVIQMEKGKDLIFTAIVDTKPEVELGKYKGIEIKKVEYNVSDEDVEHELGHMAEKNARLISIDNRPVESGDTTVIDFEGFVDGVPFEGGKAEKHELVIGSNTFIPGFEEQLIGVKLDEEKDINVKFPDEYFSKDLAGKDAVFKIKLHEIKKKEMPTIDDELAKDISEFDTLKELKASIKEKIEKENESKAKYETEDNAIKAVCEKSQVDIPDGMVEAEIDNNIKDMETKLSYQGMNLNSYLQMVGKTLEEFRDGYKEQAKVSIKQRLVIEAIGNDAKITVEDSEVEEKLKEMAEQYNKKYDEIKDNEQLVDYVKNSLVFEKTIKYIVENAKIK